MSESTVRTMRGRNMTGLLCAIFFVSGASALLFETLWFRQAGLTFGNTVWASSLVLSSFMGGLALGNALSARFGDRLQRPLLAYTMAEVAIALTGVGLVYLLPSLGVALSPWFRPLVDHPWILNPLRLLIGFLVLLIPSTAMGVTLPVLTRVLTAYDRRFGAGPGRLYGWNTLGAVTGAVAGEMYLVALWGVRGTALAAGALNLLSAAVAAWLSTKRASSAAGPLGRRARPETTLGPRWLSVAFLSGFCLLALEVIWFRVLLLVVLGHSTAFTLMLAIVLAGIALGSLAASVWLRLSPGAYRFNAAIAFVAGLLTLACYALFPRVVAPFNGHLVTSAMDILKVGGPLMFPVSVLSGVFFTFAGAALRNSRASETETVGQLSLANTAGAALGSLAGGFILLPALGMERSLFLVALLYGSIGVVLVLSRPVSRTTALASAAVFLVSLVLFPFGTMEQQLLQLPVKRLVSLRGGAAASMGAVREGLTETILYLKVPMLGRTGSHALVINSIMMADTEWISRRYMKLYVYWPLAVHPNAKRALLIAYGVGNTAKAMTDSKSLETIDVVDISRDVLEMSKFVYPNSSDSPLHDPRVHVHIEDGRFFLQTTDRRFDLITSEPPPPTAAGVVNLYTREYFALMQSRLAEGGIVAYWLPLHALSEVSTKAILRAFCDVFEDCSLWNGTGPELMMIGTRRAHGPVAEEQFVRQWKDPVVAAEMTRLGLERPEQLGALFIGDAEYLNALTTGSRPLVDNTPKVIEAPSNSQQEVDRISKSLLDVVAARDRFRHSSLIARLWPSDLLTASLPYFDFQAIINTYAYNRPFGMYEVHRLLTKSTLSTPPLWLLGSDWDFQQNVTRADPEDPVYAATQFHLGVRLLSERKYEAAAEALTRSERSRELSASAFGLRVYALCMAGLTDQAQRAVHERVSRIVGEKGMNPQSLNDADPSSFWGFMKNTFGIEQR